MASARRVLVVEDNPDAAEVLLMLVEGLGHEAFAVHTGAAALTAAAERRPDVILLDLSLPDISGIEVARRLRLDPALAAARIVGLSGFGTEAHRKRCAEAGMDACVEKPIDAKGLAALLEARPA